MSAGKKTRKDRNPGDPEGTDILAEAPPSRARLWCFRLVALFGGPAVLLALFEGALRLAGCGYDPAFLVRVEGDAKKLRDNGEFALRFFPPALARIPQPMQISREKPDGTIRILVVGGSAVMGDPEPAYGPPRVLQVLLESRFPGRKFEVINAAVTAINSHVVLPLVRDCMQLEPDLVIVYMGNNEVHGPFGSGTVFGKQAPPLWVIRSGLAARKTKLGQWLGRIGTKGESVPVSWGGLEMFRSQQVRWDDPRLQTVRSHFERNLRDIVAVATDGDAAVVLCTVAVNLKDFPPFASVPAELPADWVAPLARAEMARQQESHDDALAALRGAEKSAPNHAGLQFRIGRVLLGAGRTDEARERFVRARDLDALRFRADSRINQIISTVAAEANREQVVLADAARLVAEAEPDGIPGNRLFWEHVHFNLEGSYFLGRLFAEKVTESLNLAPPDKVSADWLPDKACLRQLGLTPFHRREITNSIRERLDAPPFSSQPGHEQRRASLREAAALLDREMFDQPVQPALDNFRGLISAKPGDWMLRRGFAEVLTVGGQTEEAIAQRREIARLVPHSSEAHYQLGVLLDHARQWEEAHEALRQAIQLRPHFAIAYDSLGLSLFRSGSPDEACLNFAKALEIMPDYTKAHLNWATVLFEKGREEEAVARLRKVLAVAPNNLEAHHRLGQHYVTRRDFRNAIIHCEEVVRIAPRDPGAYLNLGLVYLALKRQDEALGQFQKALEIDPRNKLAMEQLRKLQAGPP